MAIRVAAMAAKPAVVRQSGVIKKEFAALGVAKRSPWPKSHFSDLFAFATVHDRYRIIEGIGHIGNVALAIDGKCRGPASDWYALPVAALPANGHFIRPGDGDDPC